MFTKNTAIYNRFGNPAFPRPCYQLYLKLETAGCVFYTNLNRATSVVRYAMELSVSDIRVQYNEMYDVFLHIFRKIGFTEEKAALCAKLFTETSLDGVQSHSVLRIDFFLEYIAKGYIKIDADPECVEKIGSFERWDGHLGPGNLNAWCAVDRAVELAQESGMGCVALKNTNHWMRGGTYGWRAAEQNCIAVICTNTIPNMPTWGSLDRKIGNNPLIIAIPRKNGHIVLDMAMSQFSYGRIEKASIEHTPLECPGGYDVNGDITDDADKIMESGLPLPMGYWKGSGLAIVIDCMTAILSGGSATHDLLGPRDEYGPSQVFITFSLDRLGNSAFGERIAEEAMSFIHTARPMKSGGNVYYPGEKTLLTRRENLEKGILVNEEAWKNVLGKL